MASSDDSVENESQLLAGGQCFIVTVCYYQSGVFEGREKLP
jgi:hypothetical protein